ncbi:MAG: 30S ribosomal protein S12 methylthiotransferase RimO [Armatimonadota bacterium]|nr:30S ribosomal protein S12 methylthiotransferase RimO [bacterium]MCS7310721.1 30S ribosomal protein S12 methylthiotransferase RimO [Armatimonadota bacterium]MDW8105503.1 30S ribosomal protein S12 methylthiotransferase RimO [Armatimonadota bacterium]MDW8291198.1 30S ribosomal protein S12 methylthiotransferase RimO [Armatimonadota bacterium]
MSAVRANGNPPTVAIVNLGCAKNVVDAEEMLGVLAEQGYALTTDLSHADAIIVNTCGFIASAKEESLHAIRDALRWKRRRGAKVIVAGCLSQRYGQKLLEQVPEVDALIGVGQMARIHEVVGQALSAEQPLIEQTPPQHRWARTGTRVLSTAPWSAYLKISEGCDHKCTFCAIPSFRGAHVSKPLERVLAEAEDLARRGVREVNLIAQDSTQYGLDLYGKQMLPHLLRELSRLGAFRWIRVLYCYPSRVTEEFIETLANTPNVLPYVDVPLQHADDEILRAMRRPPGRERYLQLIRRLREAHPDMTIRSTFIVGFPGETERHFANLLSFLEEAQLDRAGAFVFSPEEDTPAQKMPEQVPPRVANERYHRLMRLQQQISLRRHRAWVGRELEVLVEAPHPKQKHLWVARSFRDAPEVDGTVLVRARAARPGEFLTVRVTDATPYDLIADNTLSLPVITRQKEEVSP